MPYLKKLPAAALGLLVVAAPFAPSLAGDDEADDVARDIYRMVERACPVGDQGAPYNLATIAERHFAPDLRDMLRRAYADHTLDFDILIDAQDCEIPDVDIAMDGDDDDDGGSRVVARAEFENFGEPRVIDLLMVRAGGNWKVADVAYRHRDWQLRRELAAAPSNSK